MAEVDRNIVDAVVVYDREVLVGSVRQHAELSRGVIQVDAEAQRLEVGALEVSVRLQPFLASKFSEGLL